MTEVGGFVTAHSFYILLAADFAVMAVLVLLWRWVWLGTHQLYIPDSTFIERELKQTISPEDGHRIYYFGVRHLFRLVRRVITEFNHEYLVSHIGFEGFTYLAFLRRIVMTLSVLCILDVCVWIPYLGFFESPERFSLITMESSENANFRTTYTIVVSVIILYYMYTLKRQLKYRLRYDMVREPKELAGMRNDQTDREWRQRSTMLNWLTLRTVNIQILSNHNSKLAPYEIKEFLQRFLNIDCESRARIADIVPIPDYGDLLNKHYDLEFYRIVKRMAQDGKIPCLWSCTSYNSVETVEAKIAQLQKTIMEESSKGVQCAVGAFMVLSSMDNGVQLLCESVNQLTNNRWCCRQNDEGLALADCPYVFSVTPSQNPEDLVWSNMQYTRSYSFRLVLMNLLCFAILLVISTPATVLNLVHVPPVFTTFFVLLTSAIMSWLLSTMVQSQKHIFQSKKETQQFLMQVFYLCMNMILVTAVRGIKNVTELFLMNNGWRWIEVFELVYKKVDGYFFCLLFVNQTASSFWISLIKPAELLQNYGSASLFIYKSKINRNNAYGRNENFQFGYYYALAVTLFSIAVLFSCSIPLVHVFALIFFISRYYLDTYTLLTFHREECQSLGQLVTRIIFSVAVGVIIQLFLVANSLLIEQKYINAIILYSVFAVAVYVASELAKPLLNDIDIVSDPEYHDVKIKKHHLEEWRQLYTHPLMKRL